MALAFSPWALSLMGEAICRQFGKRLTKPSIARIMRSLGVTPQKPLYRAWQQGPVRAERWQAEAFPALEAEAKPSGAVVYFADEVGLRSYFQPGTTWAPRGATPVAKATAQRIGMISAY